MIKNLNAKVIGAGPSGSLLAIALASFDVKVYLFDISNKEKLLSRDRTYAITHSSRRLFERLGVWSELKNKAIPFNELSVCDSVIKKSILLSTKDLRQFNRRTNAVGWTLDHYVLMDVLLKKIENINLIDMKLNSTIINENLTFDYYFAADGISSYSRKKWNIGTYTYRYRQKCITFKALLKVKHKNRAYEIFRQEGPMAILPMGKDLYQLIISSPSSICEKILKLPNHLFLDRISSLLPDGLEIDSLYNKPEVFPLSLSISKKLTIDNKFLVGESAHSIHPVGGQGLNLSIRDINSISEFLSDSKNRNYIGLFSSQSKANFILSRYLDIIFTSFLTHLLIIVFSNTMLIFKLPRKLAFIMLSRLKHLRRLLLTLFTDGIFF